MEFVSAYLEFPVDCRSKSRTLTLPWEPEVPPLKETLERSSRFGDLSDYLSPEDVLEEKEEVQDEDFFDEDFLDEETPIAFAPLLRSGLTLLCALVSMYAILSLLGGGIQLGRFVLSQRESAPPATKLNTASLGLPSLPSSGSQPSEAPPVSPAIPGWNTSANTVPPPEVAPKSAQIPDLINTSRIDPALFADVPQPDGLKVGVKTPGYTEIVPDNGSQTINVGVDKLSPDGPYTRVWYINAKLRSDRLNALIAKTKPGQIQSELLATRNLLVAAYNKKMNPELARVYKVKPSL